MSSGAVGLRLYIGNRDGDPAGNAEVSVTVMAIEGSEGILLMGVRRRVRIVRKSFVILVSSVAGILLFGSSAQALTAYSDVLGPNYHYKSIQESSSYGDPEPLFDQPVLGAGNQLDFNPTTFIATGTTGGLDNTGSQLQLQISSATMADIIETIVLTEAGLVDLTGLGTVSTNVSISMAGFATVLQDTGGFIVPVIIPFLGTFVPKSVYDLPGDPGQTLWTATATIDVASQVPNATLVQISWDNDLFATSEAGSTAYVEKAFTSIEPIPEPSFSWAPDSLSWASGLATRIARVKTEERSTERNSDSGGSESGGSGRLARALGKHLRSGCRDQKTHPIAETWPAGWCKIV